MGLDSGMLGSHPEPMGGLRTALPRRLENLFFKWPERTMFILKDDRLQVREPAEHQQG